MDDSTKPNLNPSAADRPGPLVIGLTGGIASGKSTVAAMLDGLGAEVIDADRIARDVLDSPEVCEKLRRHWGESVFGDDGHPDRARIAESVFRDPEKLKELNGWVHPQTREQMRARLDRALRRGERGLVVIDAPLLLERELDRWCDVMVFVEADTTLRAARAQSARGWNAEEVARRETAQVQLLEKRTRADVIIENNGSREKTLAQVKQWFRQWTQPESSQSPQPLHSGGNADG